MNLQSYITKSGENLYYVGNPNFELMEKLVSGPGDLWHSSLDQGFFGFFKELIYQTHIAWWYVEDFSSDSIVVSWKINPKAFVVRANFYNLFGAFDTGYENENIAGISYGFDMLRFGGIPLHVNGLFQSDKHFNDSVTAKDLFRFFKLKFRDVHSMYLLLRKGFLSPSMHMAYLHSKDLKDKDKRNRYSAHDVLSNIEDKPRITYILPTMMRQEMVLVLLEDLALQSCIPTEVIVVDGTPEHLRIVDIYDQRKYPFELRVVWQKSSGSCRARNEAIEIAVGDYVVFGDDDIRILSDFIENHVRFLRTFKVDACNGLDLKADHYLQNLDDLKSKYQKYSAQFGLHPIISGSFNNANACVTRKVIDMLKGNDINYDGGYGEDSDFGLSIVKAGMIVMHNPFSVNLHLKPPSGGYRFWGSQSMITGKKRKRQPWEIKRTVGWIRPVPSPTIMYFAMKHYSPSTVKEYKIKNTLNFILNGPTWLILWRIMMLPKRLLQLRESVKFSSDLISLGKRRA